MSISDPFDNDTLDVFGERIRTIEKINEVNLISNTSVNDTLDGLNQKIRTIAKINEENLNIIKDRKKGPVITGFSYSLQCDLPRKKNEKAVESKPWTLDTTPKMSPVSSLINDWKYTGDSLEQPQYVLNNSINYTLKNFYDVCRLNIELLMLGNKCAKHLADTHKTRAGMCILLSNMEKLKVAVGELNQLTTDAKDKVIDEGGISEQMHGIVDNFEQLAKTFPDATFSLRARPSEENGDLINEQLDTTSKGSCGHSYSMKRSSNYNNVPQYTGHHVFVPAGKTSQPTDSEIATLELYLTKIRHR